MDWGYIQNVLPLYGKAAWLTLRTGATGILLAAIVGLLCAAASHWRVPVLRRITAAYVEISRNTPLLIQLFFIYYGLPKIGIRTRPEDPNPPRGLRHSRPGLSGRRIHDGGFPKRH